MMKHLAFVFFVFFALGLNAQSLTTVTDTINGAESVNFALGEHIKLVQAKCTQLGGTSDGTLTVYGSLDNSNWVFLNFVGDVYGTASPKASITGTDLNAITITNGLNASWSINSNHWPYVKLVGAGTTGDTTAVTVKYFKKNWRER